METVRAITLRAEDGAALAEPVSAGTYNLRWLESVPGVREVLRQLGHVNVWCFQEVLVGDDESASDAALAEALEPVLPAGRWHVAVVRVNRAGSASWEAQAIASRFPITGMEVWPLDAPAGGKRRVALAVRVDAPAGSLLVVNTDHAPSFFGWRDGNSVQLRALTDRLAAVDTEMPVVLAGDFNCSGNLWRLHGNSAHVGRVDTALASVGMQPIGVSGPTFSSWPLSLVLDRIYVRGLAVSSRGIARDDHRASDHRPVWCTLERTAAPHTSSSRTTSP